MQVKGLTTFPVENVSDTVAQLEKGCQSRSKGETAMNAQSSRSHAIFSIILVKEAVTEEWVFRENSNFRDDPTFLKSRDWKLKENNFEWRRFIL